MARLADFSARRLDGSEVDLAAYDGQVVLVVNTASRCGFTPQLQGLQRLQDEYADRGFTVLGFPSDQFRQEPLGDEGPFGGRIKWNFTKFLIGRDGRVIARYAPTTEPKSIVDDVERALAPGPRGPR